MSSESSFGPAGAEQLRMGIEARQQWSFIGGAWEENEEGIVSPPQPSVDENLAFCTAAAYADFEAEFEFRWENNICGAGFIFRAQDARHYYLVHFPCTGQQYRCAHFWAAISKVDESGWAKVLKMEMVPGVPSEIGLWHQVRLAVAGNEIRLWVDGRPFPTVRDDTYPQPGYVGLESYSGTGAGPRSSFRGLRISGKVEPAAPWDETLQPRQNWFYPTLESTYGEVHHLSGVTRAPNGDLLMRLAVGNEFHGEEFTPVLIRSRDSGRTWSAQQKLPDELAQGQLHTTHDGRLLRLKGQTEPPHSVFMASSEDNGKSWSEFEEFDEVNVPEDIDEVHRMSLLELKDGTLVWFTGVHLAKKDVEFPHASYSTRSTDGGRTWSTPVNMDGPNPRPDFFMVPKRMGSEVSAAETREGKIVAFIRNAEPTMWECWSDDGGLTWRPAARGPFAMYASTTSMLSTASGALLIAGRHPGLAFHLSYDDGITWKCYRFDTTFWANGIAYEIEPDLVMYASTAKYSDPHVRVHLFRITPDGPEPVRYAEE